MNLSQIPSGDKLPHEVNIIIEIPMHAAPVKYELNKESGALIVDRFLSTAMYYPANYGFIPHTLSEDGDPVDALVLTPTPLIHGAVIAARPIGLLKMSDEAGIDAKLLALPLNSLTSCYQDIQTIHDLPPSFLQAIEHFFSHYKDLEKGKWVKVEGWEGPEAAHQEILDGIKRAKETVA